MRKQADIMRENERSPVPGWLYPAYRLMAGLGYRKKLLFLTFFLAVPLLVLALSILQDFFGNLRNSEKMYLQLEHTEKLRHLRYSLEDLRDLSLRHLLHPGLDVARRYAQARESARRLLADIRQQGSSAYAPLDDRYIKRIEAVLARPELAFSVDRYPLLRLFETASASVRTLQAWQAAVNRQSDQLLGDAGAIRRELESVSEPVYRLSRILGALRAFGSEVLEAEVIQAREADLIRIQLEDLKEESVLLELRIRNSLLPDAARLIGVNAEIQDYVERQLTVPPSSRASWETYFDRITQGIEAYRAFEETAHAAVSTALRAEVRNSFNWLFFITLVLAVAFVIYLYLMMGLYLSVKSTVLSLSESAKSLAQGDFDRPIVTDSRDEMRNIATAMETMRKQLKIREQELREVGLSDSLTGLRNQRHFSESLMAHYAAARRKRSFLTVALLDLDQFKQINDTYGHLAGDQALQDLARVLQDFFRRERDQLARFGGDEFAIILPDTPIEPAVELINQLRERVERMVVKFDGESIPITLSGGVATFDGYVPLSAHDLLRNADRALFQAKAADRNCIVPYLEADQDNSPDAKPAGSRRKMAL